jgi:16S rRNA (cytosine967-C5)-methyltransferase
VHSRPPQEGRAARDAAAGALFGVLAQGRSFDDQLSKSAEKYNLEKRDRAFARAVAAAALRHRGSLLHVITQFLDKGLPKESGRLESVLLTAAAQLLILKTPPHAAISIAVDQTRSDHRARRFDKLTNAVLRRVAEKGPGILAATDSAARDIPAWMFARWSAAYGPETARAIAQASLTEAALDLSVKQDAEAWAGRLRGQLLPTGSIRVAPGGRVEDLPGYSEGAWWVQDAAAALPVKLLGDVRGLEVADLCAAPGGKTAQLAALGARVTAIDLSEDRLLRLTSNLNRLGLTASTVAADAALWQPDRPFDAVLVDAPCTATGTIRRHPDILHLKRPGDAAQLASLQSHILDAAAKAVKPGGRLVYCTCSLEPEEGAEQVGRFLKDHPDFERLPVRSMDLGGQDAFITPEGDLRTLPCHWSTLPEGLRGLDGFYAAILAKKPSAAS